MFGAAAALPSDKAQNNTRKKRRKRPRVEDREICAFFFPFSTSTLGVCLEISEAASSTTHARFPTPKGKGENHVSWTASQYYILLVGGAGSSTNLLTVKGKGSQIKGESWFSF